MLKPGMRFQLEPVGWPEWAVERRLQYEAALSQIPDDDAHAGDREAITQSLRQLHVMFPLKRAVMVPCDTGPLGAPSESDKGDPQP